MTDFKIFPKHSVEVTIKTHCTGCGLSFTVRNMLEPQVFESEHILVKVMKKALQDSMKFHCPSCAQETAHVSWHEEAE